MANAKPLPQNLLQVRGNLVRDPFVTDRKDGSGNKAVMGRIVTNETYTDGKGDARVRETWFDFSVFNPSVADALKESKKGQQIALTGYVSLQRSEKKDPETGEVSAVYHNLTVTVDDTPAHGGSLVA